MCRVHLLSLTSARQIFRTENLHQLRCSVTAAVLRSAIKVTLCIYDTLTLGFVGISLRLSSRRLSVDLSEHTVCVVFALISLVQLVGRQCVFLLIYRRVSSVTVTAVNEPLQGKVV